MGERIQMKPATAKQVQAINVMLHKQGLMKHKPEMIEGYTNGRTRHSKEMTIDEARSMISDLYKTGSDMNVSTKLMAKLFAMAHEIGWITKEMLVKDGQLVEKKNYQAVHDWVQKFGYLKKQLREYTYNELPKLVSQFEIGPYNQYIKPSNQPT